VIKPTSSVSGPIPQIHSRNGVFSISFLYFASQCFLRQMLANPSKISNSPSTLADFVLAHCAYLSYYDLVDLSSPTIHTAEASRCQICLFKPASIDSTILQVNLDYSHHVFDAGCFSRYILSGFNRCPPCRKIWFTTEEVVAEQTATQAPIHDLEFSLDQFFY
jgi:hypothetical protein